MLHSFRRDLPLRSANVGIRVSELHDDSSPGDAAQLVEHCRNITQGEHLGPVLLNLKVAADQVDLSALPAEARDGP